MRQTALTLLGLLMALMTASAQEKNEQIISTTSGLVSGTMQEGTMAWLGIPYAKVERFMPPLPVEKWEGVRACDQWGPMTMQQTWGKQLSEDEMSENCCVLNVWTTDVKTRQAPTYMYMFTWRSPLNNGSIHGHELKFCFNTLHRAKNDLPDPSDEDLKLADTMSNVWAQFAHNGNPNIEGLPSWKAYTPENGELMVFDHRCLIRNNPDRKLAQIIDNHCFKQLDEFRRSHQE